MMIKDDKLISVIVPVYNSEKYLSNCINSIISNTYKNIEIICVNDGSTDKSLEILNKFAQNDSRIKVINKQNGGVSSARNIGLDNAVGDFVSFIDSDDYIHPMYFEAFLNLQSKSDADMVVCDFIRKKNYCNEFDTITSENLNVEQNATIEQIVNHPTNVYIWGKIYKTSAIKNIRFNENMKYAEDTLFNYAVMVNCSDFSIVKKCMYYYLDTEDSLSKNWETDELIPFLDELYKLCTNNIQFANIKFLYFQLLNKLLAYRYLTMFYCAYEGIFNNFWYKIKSNLKEIPNVSKFEKVKYSILFEFPIFYRLYRLITDPTMINWEKEQKRKIIN